MFQKDDTELHDFCPQDQWLQSCQYCPVTASSPLGDQGDTAHLDPFREYIGSETVGLDQETAILLPILPSPTKGFFLHQPAEAQLE